ncbi:MAG: molybdopterin molybdenumtransferase MoeA [Planctomycetota bacterium]|nr:MAG: molybdopterin molybdenumtransferase MoeA [Planctomycetota bacterium]
MISIQEARALVLARALPLEASESVPVALASGRRLAQDVTSDGELPPFDRVMMDGYAVRAAELHEGIELPVDGEVAAGDDGQRPLAPGTVRSIMTGAPLPPGADAVVQVEWTEASGSRVSIQRLVRPGQNVAPRGQDLAAGQVVARAGEQVTPLSLSLLIASGAGEVVVRRRPRLALLTSGDELVPPGAPVRRGQIRESNGPALAALLAASGAEVDDLGIAPDDRQVLEQRVERAAQGDVVVLTGGSSVGRYDYSAEVAEALGFERIFDRVAVKPGKPTLFYARGQTLLFCLPGNPVAALMTGRVLVAPALAALGGEAVPDWPGLRLPLAQAMRRHAARDLLVPVSLVDGQLQFEGWHGSGDLTCMAGADAFAHLERGEGQAPAGSLATLFPMPSTPAW